MHVHANPINPNAQLDAAYAAEKAAARREATRVRKKLSEFASKLIGECDSGEERVARLGSDEESQEHASRQNQQGHDAGDRQKEPASVHNPPGSISDWA
jgi:hypothetical protein